MTDFHGRHLIEGAWTEGEDHFDSDPVSGSPLRVSQGTAAHVDAAAKAAEAAFRVFGYSTRVLRAAFLESIADEIEARAEAVAEIATAETGLPEARINTERGRTTGQLRLFAKTIRDGDYLDRRHDPADPEREPLPKPDLKLVQRPGRSASLERLTSPSPSRPPAPTPPRHWRRGPGDRQGPPGAPRHRRDRGGGILAAIRAHDLPGGAFQMIHSDSVEAGQAIVTHPLVKAVGFTGSLRAGRALYDLACDRAEPIPFYGELGSINPVFCLPAAMRARADDIGSGWAASYHSAWASASSAPVPGSRYAWTATRPSASPTRPSRRSARDRRGRC